MKVNVAVAQISPKRYDLDRNLLKMESTVAAIMHENCDCQLVVFPEFATTGYQCRNRFLDFAERIPGGRSITRIRKLAKQHGVHIAYGFPEESAQVDGVLYDSAILVNASGDVEGMYRKTHLWGRERQAFAAGTDYPVFNTKIGRIGLMVCYDAAFPEVARIYAIQGAQLVCVLANWEDPFSFEWDLLTSARACENTVFMAAANRVGREEELSFFGHSRIVGPTGRTLVKVKGSKEGRAYAMIDYDELKRIRTTDWPIIRDRRPNTYKTLTHDT